MAFGLSRRAVLATGVGAMLAGGRNPAGAAPADPGSGRWRRGADLPYAVQEIYPALWRGTIAVAGGFRARAGPLIWPTTSALLWDDGQWRALADLPDGRHHGMLVALADAAGPLLAIGGFSSRPGALWQGRREVWRLDSPDGRWRPGPPLPSPQAESAAAAFPGLVVLAGGRMPAGAANAAYGDHADTGRTLVWRPGAGGWTRAADMPIPRNSMAFAGLGGRLHVVGGRRSLASGIVNLADHHAYDPATDRWTALAPLPAPRGGHAAAVLGGRLYVLGGEAFGPAPSVFADHWSYDPQTDRWRAEPPMPEGRHGLGAVALAGRLHAIGGARAPGGEGTSARHDIFQPEEEARGESFPPR